MRIRPALAISLLAAASAAPTLAAQLPARELEIAITDYYFEQGLSTSSISRTGIFVLFDNPDPGPGPVTPVGLAAFFVDWPGLDAVVPYPVSSSACFSSNPCPLAAAFNEAGRIVGTEIFSFPGWSDSQAYQSRYDPQTDTILEYAYLVKPPGFPPRSNNVFVQASAINDDDRIAGWATSGIPSVGRAPIWWPSPSAIAVELPRLPGLDAGPFPVRINTAGVIVGSTAGSAPRRAAVWRPTYSGYVLSLLGELPGGTKSRAYDIGFFGGIVGHSDDGSGTRQAVVWRLSGPGYSVTPLPAPPGGSCSAATAINTSGDIAGNCSLGDGSERGVVWRKVGGTYELLHELMPLSGDTRSVAYALDDDGQAGGGSGPQFEERPVLWPVVVSAPPSVPALSNGALLCLIAVLAGATVSRLRAHH